MPNVLLESLACGTPFVATRVGGAGEILDGTEYGRLVDRREAIDIKGAIMDLQSSLPSVEAVRAHAENFSWDTTSRGQADLFRSAAGADQVSRMR